MHQYVVLLLIFPMADMLISLQVPCEVNLEEGVEYRKIMWYKVSFNTGSLTGLVMKDIRTNTTRLYKYANHSYQIGDDLSLLHVPEHSQKECEMYRCCLWPPVGHRIQQSDHSIPQGCQSNAVVMPTLSPEFQTSGHMVASHWVLYSVIIVTMIIGSVIAFVSSCKLRKTKHSKTISLNI